MDSSVSSEHDEREPQRLSALYQYHNAPEVAPAHGLEYDDTIYPHSDKFPVVRETIFDKVRYTGKHAYESDNSPPRIIFGMKVKTFLVVAAIMLLVIVGAAVGGAVGGKDMRETQTPPASNYGDMSGLQSSSSSVSTPTPKSTSTFVAPTPTYTALSDCPASNDTGYTSTYATGSTGTVPQGAGLNFTKYCDFASPLSSPDARHISEAFVYSFSDCVEVCAAYNFWNADSNCTVAVYQATASRPGNCWVGSASDVSVSSLNVQQGNDVAILS